MGLIIPIPFTMKRKLFTFLAESPIIAKLQYGLKVTSLSVNILVHRCSLQLTKTLSVDHVHLHPDPLPRQRQSRLPSPDRDGGLLKGERCRVSATLVSLQFSCPPLSILQCVTHSKSNISRRAAAVGSERMEVQARKFYSQRNMYLCGFTLFLSLILNRTYIMILDVLRLEEKVKMYEGDKKARGEKLNEMGNANEIGQLKRDLGKKDKELQAMKKQAEGLQKEYDQLSVKYNQLNPESEARKDR
jgi:B-cell receptor-associated protein 31